MRFTISASALIAILASPLALAQSNPFTIPTSGLSATAGQTLSLKWNPTTSGTVTLVLRSGASSNLNEGAIIASNIQNSGSYSWSVPSDVTRGSDYTVEIVSDSDSSATNYTPYFVIDSTNTVATSTGEVSMGAPSSTVSVSTASNTNSATGSATTGSSSSASGSSASAAATTGGSSSSGSSSGMTTSTASGSGSSSSGAGFQSSTSASASAQSTNAAPMATAAAGLMGLVALGAMAL